MEMLSTLGWVKPWTETVSLSMTPPGSPETCIEEGYGSARMILDGGPPLIVIGPGVRERVEIPSDQPPAMLPDELPQPMPEHS
jgi:hypothetical protein